MFSSFFKELSEDLKKEKYTGAIGSVPDTVWYNKPHLSNVTMDECVEYAKSGKACNNSEGKICPYLGFKITDHSSKRGFCWIPHKNSSGQGYEYNPSSETEVENNPNDMQMYMTPVSDTVCTGNLNCIRDSELSKLDVAKKKLNDEVTKAKKKGEHIDVMKRALLNNITFEQALEQEKKIKANQEQIEMVAKKRKELEDLEEKWKQVNEKRSILKKANASTREVGVSLDMKINNNYDQISKLNSKLNRAAEMIQNNNKLFSMKGEMTKWLAIILGLFLVFAVGMILYYSAKNGKIKLPMGIGTHSLSKPSAPANPLTVSSPPSFRIP